MVSVRARRRHLRAADASAAHRDALNGALLLLALTLLLEVGVTLAAAPDKKPSCFTKSESDVDFTGADQCATAHATLSVASQTLEVKINYGGAEDVDLILNLGGCELKGKLLKTSAPTWKLDSLYMSAFPLTVKAENDVSVQSDGHTDAQKLPGCKPAFDFLGEKSTIHVRFTASKSLQGFNATFSGAEIVTDKSGENKADAEWFRADDWVMWLVIGLVVAALAALAAGIYYGVKRHEKPAVVEANAQVPSENQKESWISRTLWTGKGNSKQAISVTSATTTNTQKAMREGDELKTASAREELMTALESLMEVTAVGSERGPDTQASDEERVDGRGVGNADYLDRPLPDGWHGVALRYRRLIDFHVPGWYRRVTNTKQTRFIQLMTLLFAEMPDDARRQALAVQILHRFPLGKNALRRLLWHLGAVHREAAKEAPNLEGAALRAYIASHPAWMMIKWTAEHARNHDDAVRLLVRGLPAGSVANYCDACAAAQQPAD